MKSLWFLLSFVLVLSLTGHVFAASYWTGAGADRLWTTADNWTGDNAPPISTDTTLVRVNDLVAGAEMPLFTDGMEVSIPLLAFEVNATGNTISMDMTGGQLNLTATGDSMRVGAGPGPGKAVFNMEGGTIMSSGRIRIGWGYQGELYMSGDASIYTMTLGLSHSTGLLDISSLDAALYIFGDVTSDILAHINNDVLIAFGGQGEIVYDFGKTLEGYTTVKAIPEPSIIVLMSLGGLVISRKWRKH